MFDIKLSEEFLKEAETIADHYTEEATVLVSEALSHLNVVGESQIIEAMQDILSEALLHSALKLGRGLPFFNMTHLQAVTALCQERADRMKKRMQVEKRPGAGSYWTPERLQILLNLYKQGLKMTKAAKADYRAVRKFDNCKEILKQRYPDLPASIINRIEETGKDGEPAFLVLKFLSTVFRRTPPEYLKKMLSKSKKSAIKEK